jgi:hypothetical protein
LERQRIAKAENGAAKGVCLIDVYAEKAKAIAAKFAIIARLFEYNFSDSNDRNRFGDVIDGLGPCDRLADEILNRFPKRLQPVIKKWLTLKKSKSRYWT